MINLNARQTYRVIYFILEKGSFSQLEAHKKLKVSLARINKIVSWLYNERRALKKEKRRYIVTDYAAIISAFPMFRSMNKLLIEKIHLNLSLKQAKKMLPKKSVLCLDSALEVYSNYYRTDRVCVYVDSPGKLMKSIQETLKPYIGGETVLWLFKQDFEPEKVNKKGINATAKLRTLIDLACDNKMYYARDLFEDLWGIKFVE